MINILVAHGGDEKHIPISKKRVAMSGFDYVALGHIHKPVMDEKVPYGLLWFPIWSLLT